MKFTIYCTECSMEILVGVFILLFRQACSQVYWTLSNKPVIYGHNIILTCKTGHLLTDITECRAHHWYGGHKNKLLLYNGVSIDATKYEDRTNLSSTEFSLVIKNYTESDFNVIYTCSCGFKSYRKCLGLNDNNFIVPPLTVDTHIQQSNEMLSIYIHVERVYPRPECSVVIGERTDNLTLTSVKRDVFYNGTFEASFSIVADDCGKKPTLLCYIGNEYNIVNTSGEPIQNYTEERDDGVNTPGYTSTSTEPYTTYFVEVTLGVSLVVAVLACLPIGLIIIYKRRSTCTSRLIQTGKGTYDIIASDSDHRNKLLAMKSKIRKQTDSGVYQNDETCSLQSHVSIEDI